jgi:carbonic anhydrase
LVGRLDADAVLQRLRDGNRRFVEHVVSLEALLSHARRAEQAMAQTPFAAILGCSDSRAPAEFIFDQGLGDLFVIRVAGNIAAPSQVGSIEFAVDRFGIQLVVVLGHSNCGAVRASLDHCFRPEQSSPGLRAIVDRICPCLLPLVRSEVGETADELMPLAVRANVHATVAALREASPLLAEKLRRDELRIVGAEYDLTSGQVDFFEITDAEVRGGRGDGQQDQ